MNQKLNTALNSLLEKSVKNADYSEAFEIGSHLLQQRTLEKKKFKAANDGSYAHRES